MEKVESPDYQMDISEAGTITADNISTSSASPTISNQAENEISSGEKSNSISAIETVTKNMNSMQLTTGSIKENLENRNILITTLDTNQQPHQPQKLTPVRLHPLMIDDDIESEDSCNNSHVSNFPDVVPAHHHHQPLRLSQPAAKSRATTDIAGKMNSVNNNDSKNTRKPIYREPSPVSTIQS